ncbi:MAG: hypothetical protein GQ564_02425 [Bacteroidales bacterium]|nr:hypothetical protein [Bacteroidales bacterium]
MDIKLKFQILILAFIFLFLRSEFSMCQVDVYSTQLTAFSLDKYEEFSPSFYNNGLVFCSDRENVSIFSYQDSSKSLVSLFYAEINDTNKTNKISFFANELTTQLNDGPVTFSRDEKTIFFSRNLSSHKILKGAKRRNKHIGIFFSKKHKEKWNSVESFPYNSTEFSIKTPSLSSNGNRIYFSSNQPGGFGGFDLYYSDFIDNKWQKPVNLGASINTFADESFPYIASNNNLYFSSAGHGGLGGLDIFYTLEINNTWLNPIHLESTINSTFDDFGLITNNKLISGFFSSNRTGNDDIYIFNKNLIQFENCNKQKENKFCLQFFDERFTVNDSIDLIYEWDFGNNTKIIGEKIKYCFPKEGEYSVKLRIINLVSGDTINNPVPHSFTLKKKEQAYINSETNGYVGDPIDFDAIKSNLPNFNIDKYYWNFGEGFSHTGNQITYSFKNEGEYIVKLGLLGIFDNLETTTKLCVYKKIVIDENSKNQKRE